MTPNRAFRILVSLFSGLALSIPLAGQEGSQVRILQTNSAGTDVHIIDPATQRLVGVIEDIPHNHGAVLHADGTLYYITNEHDNTVDIVDTRTLEVVQSVPLIATPNNLSASNLARKVYVAIMGAPWVQVIDMDTNEVIKSIPTRGGVHNTFVTPDQRYAVAGMIGARTMAVIDTSTDEVVWELTFEPGEGVRPMAFETWPDGSTRRAFVQITGFHGFYVVDWDNRELVGKISPPTQPLSEYTSDGIQSAPSHGAVVLPDNSALWISSRATSRIYGYSLPDLTLIGSVWTGNPAWLTATPDSRYVYVGVASHNETAVVDVQRMEVISRIPVGQAPKRIYTAIFPPGWGAEIAGGIND